MTELNLPFTELSWARFGLSVESEFALKPEELEDDEEPEEWDALEELEELEELLDEDEPEEDPEFKADEDVEALEEDWPNDPVWALLACDEAW